MKRGWRLLWWSLSVTALLLPGSVLGQPKQILILHAYSQEYPWTKGQHEGFTRRLSQAFADSPAFLTEYLDTKRRSYTSFYSDAFADHLQFKYADYLPDLVYVTDDNALSFAIDHVQNLFPGVPVIFSGVNDYQVQDRLNPQWVTGVFEKKEVAPNLDLLSRMDRDIGRIAFVGDDSNTFKAIEREIRTEMRQYPDIVAEFFSERIIGRLLERLRSWQGSHLFLTTLGGMSDNDGRLLPLSETIARIVQAGDFVVTTMEDVYLLDGVLGGYATSGDQQGRKAAELALAYFSGQPLEQLAPITESPNLYIFDGRELRRRSLDLPSDVVAQALILNRLPSFYERHRQLILGSLVALALTLFTSLAVFLWVLARKNREIRRNSEALTLQATDLEQAKAYLDSILRSSVNVAIIATDPGSRVTYYNPTAEQLFGVPADKVLGQTLKQIHSSGGISMQRFNKAFEIAEQEGHFRFPMRQDREGDNRFIDNRMSPIRNTDGALVGFVLMSEDITEQKRSADLIRYQASYDTLTELPNRRLLLDRLGQALSACRRHGHLGAVLFLDLDNFKNINDSLGHPVGDALLREVAQRLRDQIRVEDTVSRMGGDEFVVLLPEIHDDPNEAARLTQTTAEKIRQFLSRPYEVEGRSLHITPSVGIALFPLADEGADDILRNADTAMYRSKDAGRNTVSFFLPSMQLAAEERLKTLNDLRLALERDELRVLYQPQIDVGGHTVGAEALVRWMHPDRGMISPNDFIQLAEEGGLILDIGNWVLGQALEDFRGWSSIQPHNHLRLLAVNVSPRQFRQEKFTFQVERILAESGVSGDCLTLELTENMLVEDLEDTVAKMRQLKRFGVRFSIDDFGTGYSSLAYLKRLPLDELKIDRSFVSDVAADPHGAMLVETMLTMAENLQLDAVAEGVETVAELEFLLEHGCRLFQGYHFGRPVSSDDFLMELRSSDTRQAV